MKTEKFEFVEGLLIASVMGISVPVAAVITDNLAFPAGQTAAFVGLIHLFHVFLLGACVTLEKGLLARVSVTGFTSVMSVLAGMALFRCLCEGLGSGVDYASVAGGVIVGGVTALSLLTFAVVADALKMK